jgi:ankyrin repeat protein
MPDPGNTSDPFLQALEANNASEVIRHLETGRRVEERFLFGRLPLHIAAECGATECVHVLLQRGADREACDQGGHSALICALQAGQVETARYLIMAGALIRYSFAPSDTPELRDQLRSQCQKIFAEARKARSIASRLAELSLSRAEAEAMNREMLDMVVGAVVSPKQIDAVHCCSNVPCLELLASLPDVSFNVCDDAGEWPLKVFAEDGNGEAVQWLLQHGADPDFTSTGDTALHSAVFRDHLECARLLLNAGANPNQQDVDGAVPLASVKSEAMLDLLLAHGADATIGDQCGFKPSYWAEGRKLKARLRALEKQAER